MSGLPVKQEQSDTYIAFFTILSTAPLGRMTQIDTLLSQGQGGLLRQKIKSALEYFEPIFCFPRFRAEPHRWWRQNQIR